jgi:pimeloyl-ACP methyl ester carboxylesterase
MRLLRRALVALVVLIAVAAAAGLALSWAPDRPVSALLPRWAPPPSQFLNVQGQPVHYRDEGPRDDPSPIVLIHGTSASLHTWEGWAQALKTHRRVISMDLPGFGLTGPPPTNDLSIEAYTSFVLHLASALGVQRFVVAGNSLGGEIAWHVAAAAPDRVDRLILVDAAGYDFTPKSVPAGFRLARMPALHWITEHTLPRALVASSVRNVYGDPSRVTDALVDRYYELTLREGNRAALGRRFVQSRPGADVDRLKTLHLPTLIMWGALDRLIPPEHAEQFHRDIAGSELITYEGLGHVPHEEDPARTVADVIRFLERP